MINVDLIEKYDPILDRWTVDLEPMPSKRSGVQLHPKMDSYMHWAENKYKEQSMRLSGMIPLIINGPKNYQCQRHAMD